MRLHEPVEFFSFQKRRVPAKDEYRAVEPLQGICRLQHCVACPQLFRLQGNAGTAADNGTDQIGPVADNDNIIPASGGFRRVQDMFHHGLAADFMQYLR